MIKKESEDRFRPWGEYKTIEKRKIIYIKPNSQLSKQYHKLRTEIWEVLEGNGEIFLNDVWTECNKGDFYFIPKLSIHSIRTNEDKLSLLEISLGEVYEDDIVRIEDKYGRK